MFQSLTVPEQYRAALASLTPVAFQSHSFPPCACSFCAYDYFLSKRNFKHHEGPQYNKTHTNRPHRNPAANTPSSTSHSTALALRSPRTRGFLAGTRQLQVAQIVSPPPHLRRQTEKLHNQIKNPLQPILQHVWVSQLLISTDFRHCKCKESI